MLVKVFLVYCVCWQVLEPTTFFFPDFALQGLAKFVLLLVVSAVIGLYLQTPPIQASVRLANTNTTVTLLFGDLFEQSGHKVIAVNEFFDGEVGDIIARRSVHGQFIVDVLGGQADGFYELINPDLADVPSEKVERAQGRKKKYPIGTTSVARVGDDKYFCVALTYTDPEKHESKADVPELWTALDRLWVSIRQNANNEPVSLPLIGGTFARINLPAHQLLYLIMTSIVNEAKKQPIAEQLRIVLLPTLIDEVDLALVKREWG